MSTHPQLKDLLEQAAETVPPAEVPRDTWQRGRRRHRRSLALRAAAVVGVVALVAVTPGLLDRAADRSLPQPAGDGSSVLGLPDRLHEVPSYLGSGGARERWADDVVSDDLATGTVAAAWVTQAGLPVLVDATDGTYHLLDLPDFLLTSGLTTSWFPGDAPPLALSPDGTRLAYGTAVPSGIRVVDLVTGEVTRDLPLEGGAGVVVTQVSWSPDGSWLAWTGFETSYWTTSRMNGNGGVAGVLGADGTQRRLDPASGNVLVADDGTAVALTNGTAQVHGPDGTRSKRRAADLPEITDAAALSGDGSVLAVGTQASYDLVTLRLDRDEVSTRSGETSGDGSWSVRPLGWVGDTVLVQRTPPASGDEGRLSLVDPDGDVGLRDVGVLDGGEPDDPHTGVGPLSVATDLVTEQRPTVSRPAPDWPWSEERWVLTVGLGGLGLLVAGGLAWLVRRRAQRRSAR